MKAETILFGFLLMAILVLASFVADVRKGRGRR